MNLAASVCRTQIPIQKAVNDMSKEYIGKTCPYCKTQLVAGDTVVFCSVCDMPHHLSCWQDNHGCTTFGCTGSIQEIIGNDAGAVTAPAAVQSTTAPVAASKFAQTSPTKPAPAPIQAEQPEKPVETLYESKEMVFMSDIPIVLENTAIIIDRTKDKLFARCTFRSITDKTIKAALIEITCQDVWGSTLGEPIAFQYLDLRTKRDTKFGQTNPIDLPDKTTRKIQVAVKKILFADDSVVSGSAAAFTMPAPVLLSKHLGSEALAAEYARETSPKAQFVPEISNDYWRCACGALNTGVEEKCYNCGCTKEQLTVALNPETLNANMVRFAEAKRAAAERAQAEQAERIRLAEEQVRLEQERKEREIKLVESLEKSKKRRKKTVKAIIISLIVIAILGCGTVFFGIPYFNYQAACEALDNGEYDTAHQAFVALGNFMDSEEMANKSLYEKGKAALKNKQYNFAIQIFGNLGDYKDSEDQVLEAKYLMACNYLEKKNYKQAISIFEDISYYKNSADKIKEAKYGYVLAHKNNTDTTTYDYLLALRSVGYKDAAIIYKNLYAWKVTVLGWNSDEDSTSYQSSISKYRAVYCHFKLTGGTPGASTTVSISGTYPGGGDIDYTFKYATYDGWTGWYGWPDGIYTYPAYGDTGTIQVYFYDDDGNQIGSGSVKITR